ncbi:MAG: hypothetical protein QOF51_2142 [Chloroflexota bacterium]|jgi:mannose-6-phosphate isomerase-like protein (cupin superfamily)|nr:hypothetical protein [Chloroflexota bacterium]
METATQPQEAQPVLAWSTVSAYDRWAESVGIPIHSGYFIPDARTVELGRWDERECDAAFLKLAGQEGVTEARVSELRPGATMPPLRFAIDEAVYILSGQGQTTIWAEGGPKRSFEWQAHSMFLVPRNHYYQFANMSGTQPARLLHFSHMPLAMNVLPDPHFYFNDPYQPPQAIAADDFYAEAKVGSGDGPTAGRGYWVGNFFPDMTAWDHLDPFRNRGAGGRVVTVAFPTSTIHAHMSVFPKQTYKKAHRHGPGVTIVIPSGEGFSVMWPEGQDKIFIPWHEGSVFVPPNRWFHQHFNLGREDARYLALHSPRTLTGRSERVEDLARDQIEYAQEDPWIRETFKAELAKHNMTSAMPDGCYEDPNYQWAYSEDQS